MHLKLPALLSREQDPEERLDPSKGLKSRLTENADPETRAIHCLPRKVGLQRSRRNDRQKADASMKDESRGHESYHRDNERCQDQDTGGSGNSGLYGPRESLHREERMVDVKKKDVAKSTSDKCEKMEERGRHWTDSTCMAIK